MKTSKKILSIVLALVLLTTMVTSVFYASACNKNNHDPYKEATTVLDLLDNKLDAYDVDLAGTLDGLVNSKDLINQVNGLLTEEKLNSYIYDLLESKDILKYLESGQWLIELGNEKLAEILQQYLDTGTLNAALKGVLKEALESIIKQLPDIQYLDALFPNFSQFDKAIEEALSQYLDGEKLIAMLDKLVADAIEGKLIYDENGRKVLKAIDAEWAASLDKLIEGAIGEYVNDGSKLVILGDEKIMELLNNLQVLGVPVLQLRYISTLDTLVENLVLADGSDIMVTLANALSSIFPDVQPNYESIVSCLIPLLSALSLDYVMGNISNLPAIAGLADPVTFAYLAGIDDPLLDPNYLDTVNGNLSSFGYNGAPVTPMISLTPEQQTKLMEYVAMAKGGKTLAEIAEAGFKWEDFAGDVDTLDLANALLKIDIGDNDRLGSITSTPGVGTALTRILCDLLNDIKSAPVSVLIKKLSNPEDIAAIADVAMNLLNDNDYDFKSFELFFDQQIYYDGEGNTTFYDYLDEHGVPQYSGPKAMDQYLPVIAAGIDLLSNLSGKIEDNGGDILKTLLVDKLPQLGNVIRAAINYKDEQGQTKMGLIAYLLDDYKDYLLAENASLSDDVLISIAQAAIAASEEDIAKANAKIAKWEVYLEQAQAASDAAKLAKAKELGLVDPSETTYDEEAVNAAIEQKIASLRAEMEALEPIIAQDQLDVNAADQAADEAYADYGAANELQDYPYDEPFYSDLCAIFDDQDISLLDNLRADCEDDFNDTFGEGKFDELASYITDYLADYDNDADTFIDDWILADGIGIYNIIEAAKDAYDDALDDYNDAVATLEADQKAYDDAADLLAQYESGAIKAAIDKAGADATIYIEDPTIPAIGDFTVKDIQDAIKTIENEEIAAYEANIAAEEAKIQDYIADKNAQQSIMDNYDLEGLNLEQKALEDLVDALMVFLGGDESTKSLYEYFEDGQPIEMLVAPDRVNALKAIVDNLITLFGDKIGSGGEYETKLWEIEDILFGDKGILSTLYNDFIDDPVLSIVTRVKPLRDIVDIVYDMGFFRDLIDQYKELIEAAANLFGDDSDGFIALWKTPYDDGTANHHYVNAVLSLLPKLVAIYDQVKDIEAVKELIGPYTDLIDFVLGLLTKDFYDDVVEDGIVETLLEDEKLDQLRDIIIKVLDTIQPENYEYYKLAVELVFDKILDGLYQDLLVDPVLALTKRVDFVLQLAPIIAMLLKFDISPYQPLIDDVRTLIDDNFTKDWQKSKLTALINRVDPLTDVLNDVLDIIQNLPPETLDNLLNNLPEDIRSLLPDDIIDKVITILRNVMDDLDKVAENLVNDYHKSPVNTIAKRVPVLVDMIDELIGDDDVVNLILALLEKTDFAQYEDLIRRVIANFSETIGPDLKEAINEDTVALYKQDKLAGILKIAGGALDILKNVLADETLIDEILALDAVKNIPINEDTTVGDISDAIKTLAALIPEILDGIDINELVNNLLEKPVETIVELAGILANAIDKILASDDPFIKQYTEPLEKTLELVRDLLDSFSIENGRLTSTYLNEKKPLNSELLGSEMIKRIQTAANEVADFIESLKLENGDQITEIIRKVAKLLGNLDGAVDKISSQSLFKTFDDIIDIIKNNKDIFTLLKDVEIAGYKVGDFLDLVDPLLALLDGLGADAEQSIAGAVLSRIGLLGDLIRAIFANEAICNIEIAGYRIGDFKDAADILLHILDENFGEDFLDNPLRCIFDRIEYIKALYEWIKDFGILDSLDLKIFGYDILAAVDILLPVLDTQLYYDFEQSLFKAITSSDRIGRIEEALKGIIRFLDIFSYSVNEGLCSAISGICGVLDGLYDSLVLPTSPANGGNQLNSTARVLVKKLPAIQNLLRSLKPLLGKGKLINLTDVISDTVKMEKDDILKAIVGVDMIKPYYYGISDVLDVVGENAAKYDWNTFATIIDALNGVGKKLVPALEKALGVSDVQWKDLKLPQPEYAVGGTAEDYLVELSGELGEGILTQLVGTLLKAALTIPAIKDMIGDVDAEAVAGLLNDLLEFDFKDNKVEFDAFNTEHLILTGLNLLLPKTAPEPSPATADEVVMIVAVIGTTAAASTGVYFTLKKRREEMGVNA